MTIWGRSSVPEFPDRRGERQNDNAYAKALRKFGKDWVEYFIGYYTRRASWCRRGSYFIRGIAFVGIVLGGAILVCRALSKSTQQWVMQNLFGSTGLEELPAELGLVLFALAAGVIAVDRFGNISANWMRYIITMLLLRKMLVEFQLASVDVPSREPTRSNARRPEFLKAELERSRVFLASVFEVVQRETQEWADEYRKNRSQLEGYLKIQETALREKRQKTAAGGK